MRPISSLLLVGLLAATSWAAAVTPATQATLRTLSGLSGTAFDVAVMRELIPIHEEAVEIAMAATLAASHTQLLKWNQVLVERKSEQVRTMLAMLRAMGSGPGRRMVGVQTANVKAMRQLKDAALERAYLPLMAGHLEQSAALAQLAAKKAGTPEVRALAGTIAAQETRDAATLRGWLRAWYDK